MLRVPSSISPKEFESLQIQDMTFVAYRNNIYPSKNEIFFEEHAIIYVLEGEKKFISPTQDIHVQKGQILFFQRGCYSMNESIDVNYRSLVFFFPEKLLKEFVGQNLSLFEDLTENAIEQILSLESSENFDKFVDSLIPFFSTRTKLMNQFLKLKFNELMLHLIELDPTNQFRQTLFNIYQGQKLDLAYFLENYYLKPLSIAELAQISGRSLSAFKRDFEQQFHTSPAAWIKNKRLEYAYFLLQNSPKNVSEISLEIGYESVSHFIKAFKEKYGFTPNKIN
ncbi:transcriptional regulator, AraC family [Emticicia oligotrophica DSM 17448]|uniref:Transcriptional regulator, AraC family n=1 Tax=Emticicia oligotrophica (strain DSM 17448 / CIP 109782 / MTCC 6937 / GPTSA100-15) TaxID=929562 RepID=A0ABM5N0H7_EMTOG|nr:helix-turn-helix domain-containing protein [Emticicia oligotrophica]AFK02852.1 transcriptional regulator, AraC family [Emticicia oligotrophica DSM 17448]